MKDFRSAAQQYLADKGCKTNRQKYTALEIVTMLNEFAQEQEAINDLKRQEDEQWYNEYHNK